MASRASRVTHTAWELVRFGFAGMLNTAFGYAAFAVLLLAGLPSLVAVVAAAVAGVGFNFLTSRHLVFQTAARGRALRFAGVYVLVIALNWTGLQLLEHARLPPLAGQAVLTLPLAAVAYLGQKFLVFGQGSDSSETG